MALQSIRYGGGVWKQQEETRMELQRRLEQSESMLRDAKVEVDRVHTQCVVLLQEKNELKVNLSKAETQLRRQDEELHAAKQNVAEFMALLTQANEDREQLDRELKTVTMQWHCLQDQEQDTAQALEQVQRQYEESHGEARRLRDLLYESQEKNDYQQQELQQLRRQVEVLVHSNQSKDSQVVTLIRERDVYAQKLAHYRSRITEGKPLPREMNASSGRRRVAESDEVTWTEIAPSSNGEIKQERTTGDLTLATVEFEKQKQRLRAIALQAKARFERERESNAVLQKRVEALEKSHDELLVRFREASKARQRVKTIAKISSTQSVDKVEDATHILRPVQAA